MKKRLFLFIFSIFLVFGGVVSAISPTVQKEVSPTAVVTVTQIVDQTTINKLKEKVESKISEKLKNSKAISGVVTAVRNNSFDITTSRGETMEIKPDDALTKYYRISGNITKELRKSDVKKGVYLIVTGPQFDRVINANVIYFDEAYLIASGKITEVNKDNFFLKVLTEDKDEYILDIETTTLQQILNIKTLAIERIGFSKLKEGDTVHFVVKQTDLLAKQSRFSAARIFVIPQEYFIK